jgi:hypothetical protein
MASSNSHVAKLGRWLGNKRNFYIYSIVTVGIPGWIGLTWWLGGLVPSPLWILFLALVSLLGSLASAFCMWHFFKSQYPTLQGEEKGDAT